MYFNIKVLGGLEVEIYVDETTPDEWHVVTLAGRPVKRQKSIAWLYNRIEAGKDYYRILEAIEENRLAA